MIKTCSIIGRQNITEEEAKNLGNRPESEILRAIGDGYTS
jgi:hypothetical protein